VQPGRGDGVVAVREVRSESFEHAAVIDELEDAPGPREPHDFMIPQSREILAPSAGVHRLDGYDARHGSLFVRERHAELPVAVLRTLQRDSRASAPTGQDEEPTQPEEEPERQGEDRITPIAIR
jgi:hypothetical protein